eukprot:CAMPEP_0119425556 /NCGR_PEP_ID=MMETSP1335-20130426/34681_1 /TAXON_ID=259385 /ORGANISM="Chrysoculter rhomboideus, Strain RCC1486" /LENGTH=175 /DNA_ID=CAMNT_0007451127 /DNA_START=169 /DNA_END=692 /DNA_ORIENTATION=-
MPVAPTAVSAGVLSPGRRRKGCGRSLAAQALWSQAIPPLRLLLVMRFDPRRLGACDEHGEPDEWELLPMKLLPVLMLLTAEAPLPHAARTSSRSWAGALVALGNELADAALSFLSTIDASRERGACACRYSGRTQRARTAARTGATASEYHVSTTASYRPCQPRARAAAAAAAAA